MTVKELIDQLKDVPEDAEVHRWNSGGWGTMVSYDDALNVLWICPEIAHNDDI